MSHIRSLFFDGPLQDISDKVIAAYENGRPSEIIWNITNKCNLLCKHCYVGADCTSAAEELNHEEAMDLIDRIGEAKVPLLFVTGGEPFMRKDLYDILAKAQSYGIRTVMSTNATLIDDEAADKLKEYGVDYVAISLYGPEEFHDEYVLIPGSYQRTVAAIKRLQARGIKVGIKTTVNAATFPYFFKLIDVAKDLGAGLIYPCDMISSGRAVDLVNLHDQRISKEQWHQIADFMLEDVMNNEKGLEYDIGAMPSISAYLAEKLISMGRADRAEKGFKRMRIKSSCPVGKGLMGITSEGNVLPCSFVQDFHLGNIREISIQEAAQRTFELAERPVEGKCGQCKYAKLCRGCRVKAFHASQNIMGEDETCMLSEELQANGCGGCSCGGNDEVACSK